MASDFDSDDWLHAHWVRAVLTRSSRKLNVLILIALIGLIVAASLGYGAMQMDS